MSQRGQAAILIVAGLFGVLAGAFVLGAVARGIEVRADVQRAADLAALAGARAMRAAYPRLFEPPLIDGRPNPAHLEKPAYLGAGRGAAERVARLNGATLSDIAIPDAATFAPARIRVTATRRIALGRGGAQRLTTVHAVAEAELTPAIGDGPPSAGSGPGYRGPLAYRQGMPMRPDVADAFDRLAAAAEADGVHLIINSGYRSDAEQAVLFARHPDPRWVAPPGRSLHRLGTELDLGPPSAYAWLRANAPRRHWMQRYAWEPWHWGYELNPASAATARGAQPSGRPPVDRWHADGRGALPDFVPTEYQQPIARAAQRWSVSAALLAAQLYAESNFNPFARSPAGAQGIAQFMPATARAYGLANPHDPERAIDAHAHVMRDLLREFATVSLALAAYNAGPARVRACGCIPSIPETRGYVARILALMAGAGESVGGELAVRLVAA